MTADNVYEWLATNAVGRHNAQTRSQMVIALHIGDRQIRKFISEINSSGKIVVNISNDDVGYYIPTEDEMSIYGRAYYRQEVSRYNTILQKLAAMKRTIYGEEKKKEDINPDQITIFDWLGDV